MVNVAPFVVSVFTNWCKLQRLLETESYVTFRKNLGQVAPEERTHRVSVDPFLTRFRHLTIASPEGRGTLR